MAYVLFYLLIALLLLPWLLLAAGALDRLRRRGGRLRRMQVEGALMVLVGSLAKWAVFDPHFGFDRYGSENWSYWFSRGEVGLFGIGLLIFLLGFALARRPRQNRMKWPVWARAAGWLGVLAGACLAFVAFRYVTLPALDLPWSLSRVMLTLGFLPFALAYALLGRKQAAAEDALPED